MSLLQYIHLLSVQSWNTRGFLFRPLLLSYLRRIFLEAAGDECFEGLRLPPDLASLEVQATVQRFAYHLSTGTDTSTAGTHPTDADELALDAIEPVRQGKRHELHVILAGAAEWLVDHGEGIAADAMPGQVEVVDGRPVGWPGQDASECAQGPLVGQEPLGLRDACIPCLHVDADESHEALEGRDDLLRDVVHGVEPEGAAALDERFGLDNHVDQAGAGFAVHDDVADALAVAGLGSRVSTHGFGGDEGRGRN